MLVIAGVWDLLESSLFPGDVKKARTTDDEKARTKNSPDLDLTHKERPETSKKSVSFASDSGRSVTFQYYEQP